MTLARLRPGTKFCLTDMPHLVGELIRLGEGSATIDWIGQPTFETFEARGKIVCIERSGRKRTTITRHVDVTPL